MLVIENIETTDLSKIITTTFIFLLCIIVCICAASTTYRLSCELLQALFVYDEMKIEF